MVVYTRSFTLPIHQCTRSKKNVKLFLSLVFYHSKRVKKNNNNHRCWISPSSLRNFLIKDSLVDWLKMHHLKILQKRSFHQRYKQSSSSHMSYLMQQGISFETNVINYLRSLVGDDNVKFVSNKITDESVQETCDLVIEGKIPFIHSAPLRDTTTQVHGIADLLVREDHLHFLNNFSDHQNQINNNGNNNSKYVVVEVKMTTLPMAANKKNLYNSGNFQFYKCQVYFYAKALNQIQQGNTTPTCAYILGRRQVMMAGDMKGNLSLNCMHRLGKVDFLGYDNQIPYLASKAIEWYRSVQSHGKKWRIFPHPSHIQLYPNMSSHAMTSGEAANNVQIYKIKQSLADHIGEITCLWYCGIKERNYAHKNHNITSWRDPRCSAETLGWKKNSSRSMVINRIIGINRNDDEYKNMNNMYPQHISTNLFAWRDQSLPSTSVFIDFETLIDDFAEDYTNSFPISNKCGMIFMIGMFFPDEQVYHRFTASSLEDEENILRKFIEIITQKKRTRLFFWSAEQKFWFSAMNRHGNKIQTPKNWQWCDLLDLFRSEPIVVKDTFNFSLKNIANAMYKHGMISCKIQSNCCNGLTASMRARELYLSNFNYQNIPHCNVMEDIALYNKFDCQVLWEILKYLRHFR